MTTATTMSTEVQPAPVRGAERHSRENAAFISAWLSVSGLHAPQIN